MSHFAWDTEENAELIKVRGLSFERVIYHIERDGLIARTFHKPARALACSLIPQEIILNRPDQ